MRQEKCNLYPPISQKRRFGTQKSTKMGGYSAIMNISYILYPPILGFFFLGLYTKF